MHGGSLINNCNWIHKNGHKQKLFLFNYVKLDHKKFNIFMEEEQFVMWYSISPFHITVKCRCNERQYNEMFRIAKLFLGPFPFPYLMCVKTFHFNEFRTFSITN